MKENHINFNWYFIEGFNNLYLSNLPTNAKKIDIPHNVKQLPYNYFDESNYQGIFTYFKKFDMMNLNEKSIYILKFDGYMVKAKIYLNGHYFGEYPSLYRPVTLDISEFLKPQSNFLVVVLDTNEDPNLPPFGKALDYMTFGGIYRGVKIIEYKKKYIEKSYVFGDMDGNLTANDYFNYINTNDEVIHEVYYGDELIKSFKGNNAIIEKPMLWDIDSPNLYTLKTRLFTEYGEETYTTKFGFRTAIFKQDGFYLNNKKIKLMGLNRHQSYPYIGYAATKSLQINDANILKYEAGVNVVRTSHYMQDEAFLSRCDEIGLLVIDEIPGWQHIGLTSSWRKEHYLNVSSMAKEAYNHPSIIAHGVRIDESIDDHELYEMSNKICHDIDHNRQTLGVRNIKNSELLEDIYAYNDFSCLSRKTGLIDPSSVKKQNKPYLVTECIGHTYPTKPFDSEERRLEHAYRHAKVINDSLKYDNICGVIGWCAFDYNTHKDFGSGDRICYHGVFDAFRNRKYASYIYESQSDNVPVLKSFCSFLTGDYPETFYQEIYVATNADYIELYKNNKFVKKYTPNHREFKYLKHPLIKIDDIVGETFDDPSWNKGDRAIASKCLSKVGIGGFKSLTILDYLKLAYLLIKYHLNYNNLLDMFNTYVSSWGNEQNVFEIKAFKNNKEVAKELLGPSKKNYLNITLHKEELKNEETYDTVRVIVKHVNEYNQILTYSSLPLKIEAIGPIELLSPENVSLLAGQISIYVRSLNSEGTGILKITSSLGENNIKIKVS